jgi:hypothetical protein
VISSVIKQGNRLNGNHVVDTQCDIDKKKLKRWPHKKIRTGSAATSQILKQGKYFVVNLKHDAALSS